jgi:hypothetical protein
VVRVLDMAGSLLSLAHRIFGPGFCPGDWVWGTITYGFLLGLLPMFAALLVSLVRKGTGNRYDVVTLSVFGGIGGVLVFLLPWSRGGRAARADPGGLLLARAPVPAGQPHGRRPPGRAGRTGPGRGLAGHRGRLRR